MGELAGVSGELHLYASEPVELIDAPAVACGDGWYDLPGRQLLQPDAFTVKALLDGSWAPVAVDEVAPLPAQFRARIPHGASVRCWGWHRPTSIVGTVGGWRLQTRMRQYETAALGDDFARPVQVLQAADLLLTGVTLDDAAIGERLLLAVLPLSERACYWAVGRLEVPAGRTDRLLLAIAPGDLAFHTN